MAEVLEEYEFVSHRVGKGSYPWDEWLDGEIRLLVRDEDYRAKKDRNFVTGAQTKASKRGLKLKYDIVEDGVVIQAVPREKPARKKKTTKRKARAESEAETE